MTSLELNEVRVTGLALGAAAPSGSNNDLSSSAPAFPFSAEDGPNKRRRFDEWFQAALVLKGARADALLTDLEGELLQREQRERKRKPNDLASFRRTLNSVIANAFWGEYFPASPDIAYWRRNGAYGGPLWPAWLTPNTLKAVVDGAAAAGFLDVTPGRRSYDGQRGVCSTFRMAMPLHDKLFEHSLSFGHFAIERPDLPLIILKDDAGELVDFVLDENEEVRCMADHLTDYNAFLQQQSLSLDCAGPRWRALEEEMAARTNKPVPYGRAFRSRRRPETFRATLYRVFNDGRWDHGGRFYGGWWQEIPSGWRRDITINDKPTIELDYSGFSVRALYHQSGIDYPDNPYVIDQMTHLGLPIDYEPEIKRLVQALLNCPPGKDILRVPIGRKLPRKARRTQVLNWLREKHQRIAHAFHSREGVRLQCLEASIVNAILTQGIKDGVVVLPVHDSYLVQANHEDWLRRQMVDCYEKVFGLKPIVKIK